MSLSRPLAVGLLFTTLVTHPFGHVANGAAARETPSARQWVWFEGESTSGDEPELSGGGMTWIRPGGTLEKTVEISSAGTYTLWVRKFWNPQAFRWRLGDSPWKEATGRNLSDLVMLGGDAGRRVGWFSAGQIDLPAGSHTFRLEVPPDDRNTTAYDCFLLTRAPFQPRGRLRPDESFEINQPGWFAFQPEPDPFGASPIDLRWLNEKAAGDGGFIRVDGEEFIHEKTRERVRFWGVNAGMGVVGASPSEVDTLARALAKRGVNLVRIHGPIYEGRGPDLGRVETNRVRQVQYFVRAMKREGIYTALSLYFPLWLRLDEENTVFPGYSGGKHPFGLLYFNDAFEAMYREWWRAVLTGENPYGPPLREEPALAYVEMLNEDSTFFWTFNPDRGARGNIPDPQRAILERKFADWLRARHQGMTLEEIRSAKWDGVSSPQDDFESGRVGIRSLWSLFNERTPRDIDTATFLTELLTGFHQRTYRYFREELGCRSLVCASNWRTASAQYLDPLDKLANGVGDFFDRHGYFEAHHEGPNSAWNIETGQTFDDLSALRFRNSSGAEAFSNPFFDMIYDGKPSVISEVNWPGPNHYRADMVLVGAAYGALQGTDAIMWFALGSGAWDGLPGKFSTQTPVVFGQFPATALLYRKGLVRTGPRVVDLDLNVSDLLALKGTPAPAAHDFDLLRSADVPPGGLMPNVSAIDSLAFLIGRVGADFVTNAPASRVMDLSPYLDRSSQVARSHTGELAWHWGAGRLEVNAPAAQGVTGFVGAAGPVRLGDLTIESPMEYGTILVVALDGKPIRTSTRLLVQVASEERPHQWGTDKPEGPRKIVHRGTVPLLVKNFAGTVRFRREDADRLKVTPLDFNGYPVAGPAVSANPLEFHPEVASYLVEDGI